MKDWKRTLAALLAAIMLVMPFGATAEPELELNGLPEADAGLELEIAPEAVGDAPDVELELDDALALDGLDIKDIELETTIEDAVVASSEAEVATSLQENASDSDFKIDENGVLVEYNGKGGDVVIPDGVTSIGKQAFKPSWFWDSDKLTNITIPDSVTSIGEEAFYHCEGLTSVTIPDSVTTIGKSAFYDCVSLTSVTIGNGVTSIGDCAFRYCHRLTSVSIPDSVTSIGESAFHSCFGLTSLPIGNGVTSIGKFAFYYCKGLISVIIPDNVTIIGEGAFGSCNGLTSVTIGNGVTSIEYRSFEDCTSLISVTIPDSVTSIGGRAFEYCNDLTNVTIGSSVTSIGDCAFRYCDRLTSVSIPDSVTSIGESAFYSCSGLTSLTIGNGVTSIGKRAFYDCKGLTSVIIPESVVNIGEESFYSCSLTSVTIYATKISIVSPAFDETNDSLKYYIVCNSNVAGKFSSSRTTLIHNEVFAPAVEPTYTEPGKTEGMICAVCGEVFSGRKTIPMIELSKSSVALEVNQSDTLEIISLGDRAVTWSSSDNSIASVVNGTVTAVSEGRCIIYATFSDGHSLVCKVTVTDSAYISKNNLTLNAGKAFSLSVKRLSGRTVTWTSSDNKVATVKGGTVTAIKAGTCTITAKVTNGKTFKCEVTVKDPAKLSKTKLSMNAGKTATLKVYNFGNRTITWSSSNKKVAMVKDGIITAIKAGRCIITATLSNGKKLKCSVTVEEPAYISKTKLSINAGRTATLKVHYLGNRKVTWSSSDKKVATVKNGTVTAIKAGACTIIATLSNGKTFKCKVTVKDAAKLNKTKLSMIPGDSQTLKINGLYNRKVTWSSNDEKIATVKDGKVTAVYIGSCTVTAQIKNGKKLTCRVTVTDAATLSNDKLTISNIDTDRIALTGGLNRKVTWSTSNKNVVEITRSDNNSASIKAVKNGSATITAKVEGGKTLKCVVKVVDPLTIELDEIDEESIYNKVWVYFNNHSNKKITYVTLNIAQYNNRGDRLKSPYDYYYLNETVSPHDSLHHYYWVNDDTKKVRITITEVTFADKTTWRP